MERSHAREDRARPVIASDRTTCGRAPRVSMEVARRVAIADGHPLMRQGLQALLQGQPRVSVVGAAGDGHACLALCERERPDLLLAADGLDGMSGVDVSRRAVARCPGTRVLCLAEHPDRAYVRRALSAGVHGIILRRSSFDEVLDGIEGVFSKRRHVGASLAHLILDGMSASDAPPSLTPRERQITTMYARGRRTRDIAETLRISMKTVGTHRENIFAKLGISSIAELTRHALLNGLADDLAPPRAISAID